MGAPTVGWRREVAPFLMEARYMLHLFRLNKLVLTGTIIATGIIGLAIFGPMIVPWTAASTINLPRRLQPPSSQFWLGTDDWGRDMVQLLILGARVDVSAALTIVAGALTIGLLLGSISAFIGGKFDEAMMRVTDVFFAFPFLIFALAVAAVLGRTLENLIFAIVVVAWPGYTRLIRGQVLAEKEKLYVEALRALGAGRLRIIIRHVLPNTIYPVLVQATLDLGGYIITFAALSFLGFGPGPLTPEWGRLVADGERYLFQAPWIITFPGLAILITSLAFNLLGDGLRDVLDPRLRR